MLSGGELIDTVISACWAVASSSLYMLWLFWWFEELC